MTENSHWQTSNFELDQNIDEFDQKYINNQISIRRWTLACEFDVWIWHVKVHHCGNIYYIFGHVQMLTLVVVNFLVMFTDFGHIHSVILILSSE